MKVVSRIAHVVVAACLVTPALPQIPSLRAISDGVRQLAERVSPAVVQVHVTTISPGEDSSARLSSSSGSGSGVIVDPNGYIVTNAHVVGVARHVRVTLARKPNGSPQFHSIVKPAGQTVPAKVVGIDRETDVAVLKVDAKDLPHLTFANSELVRQGDFVFAVGSPFGLENSVSMGVVSSVARQIRPDDPMIYIQTDASINPGNSGGPLLDSDGHIAGINTFIFTQSGGNEGIGFAVPGNVVRAVYQQIRQHGRVRRGQIGVIAQTIQPAMAAALGLSQDWGVVLADVMPESAADAAGLQSKDIVLTLNGKPMENARQFGVNIYQYAGEIITVEILRNGQKLEKQIAVLERPRDPDRILSLLDGSRSGIPRLGILAVDLDEKVTPLLPPLRRLDGVVVAGLAPGAPAMEEEFLSGDVIYELNNKRIRNMEELRGVVQSLPPHSPVAVLIERQGQLQFLVFELDQ